MNQKEIDALWISAIESQADYSGRALNGDVTREFARLVEQHLIASGYRKCAEGQRTTQWCGMVEHAVKAERDRILAICTAKEAEFVAESDKRRGEEDSPFFFGKEVGAEELIDAIRARGEV